MHSSQNTTEPWNQRSVNMPGLAGGLVICTYSKAAKTGFINPGTGSEYDLAPNGDDVRIARTSPNALRICVVDGVSGQIQTDLPDGFTSPAVYARTVAIKNIPTARDAIEAMRTTNSVLHNPSKGIFSPNVCVSTADIEIEDSKIRGTFLRAGDCETYVFKNGQWEQLLAADMLTDKARELFEKLKSDCLPEINEARQRYGMESPQFKELFQSFANRERDLLEDPNMWRSLPVGRYPSPIFEERDVMTATAEGLEAVLVTSDGPHTSDRIPFTEILNGLGHPRNLSREFFESRREGWNDMAAGLTYLS